MEGQTLLFIKLTLLIGCLSAERCDQVTTAQVKDGNLGQSGAFTWLGVLNVHIHEGDNLRIATSGIVLIKIEYALAHADDMVRIPQSIFKTNSTAMFLVAQNTSWYVKPASYVTHPEYEYSTLNSIAVVKLNHEFNYFPLTPICLPTGDTFHASSYLYLTGFTDDNQILEKVIYKIQYLDKKVCEEFYNRTVVPSQQLVPSAYLCGYAPNSAIQCVWENGMVLVSRASGYYNLIGFGIYGPGCAAPARFIDLFPYFSWIKSVTSMDEAGYRRKQNADNLITNVPIHELFTMKGSRRHDLSKVHEFKKYPFDKDTLEFHLIERAIDDEHTLLIIPFHDTWQAHNDSKPSVLMYDEYFELYANHRMKGTATYKLSFYDLAYVTCSYVRLSTYCDAQSDAILSFKEQINLNENTKMSENWALKTPEELFKYFPERKEKPEEIGKLEPISELKDDDLLARKVMNYDLYIKLEFTKQAILKFEMFGKPVNHVRWKTMKKQKMETITTITTTKPTTRRTTQKTTTIPLLYSDRRAKQRSHLGMVNWANKFLKEAEVRPVANVKGVQETESAAHSEEVPRALLMVFWLVSACLKRAFFIY